MLKLGFSMTIFDRDGACVGATRMATRREGDRRLAGWLRKAAAKRLPERGPFTVEIRKQA